ncbi:MAG TPA: glycosyltransferase, partial [Blastocatellia bacterium]|nr:glycosyltransferase [Blastocatellia bacterium]
MISVLICSRNRASSLRQTLEAVFSQPTSVDYEIVVVDNGSTDGTPHVVEKFISQYPDSVRYHFEAHPGLSQARNSGLKVVRGDIIAFTDDDVLVAENWLDEIHKEFANDQKLGVLVGRVLLASAELQPVGIQESLDERTFDSAEHAVESAYNTVIGANMAFRREVFEQCGDYDVRLGAGRFFAACEDLDMACRAMKAGYRMKYAPNVVVYHNHDRVSRKQA